MRSQPPFEPVHSRGLTGEITMQICDLAVQVSNLSFERGHPELQVAHILDQQVELAVHAPQVGEDNSAIRLQSYAGWAMPQMLP